jgi:hypothetical protein
MLQLFATSIVDKDVNLLLNRSIRHRLVVAQVPLQLFKDVVVLNDAQDIVIGIAPPIQLFQR